ncbi:type II toxin-antitoxin system Phd/YefM family antitoxin [Lederbergia wuyishanensis]|uniref:Antitoxin n=1 Tax=Lederbergia wuyishanensis TaxID=1347903 RepID=A0ABU0D2E4_9BACI|nr:type II toxin-antitoxin system Phd/YefM family antitoxin [Lederbergia wuyishanensis]MCJ8007290.1 type II toxin-antitoxin system Phd/YefM family antitoxin [Lederbergia wuyishanensis]MDQ0342553.1 prevent-host-death family protein [Lederbergia wuyishanensis]
MSMQWQIQEAKNRLSQLVKKATDEGPQIISVRGKPTAVVLSVDEYERLTKPKTRLTDFFKESPLQDVELDIERSTDHAREVEL